MSEHHQDAALNGTAIRTLNALEKQLQKHIGHLMAIDCEDAEAAEAILVAVRAGETAIENTRAVRHGTNRD